MGCQKYSIKMVVSVEPFDCSDAFEMQKAIEDSLNGKPIEIESMEIRKKKSVCPDKKCSGSGNCK